MWLVKNKKGEVVHEIQPSRFRTAMHKAACISGGTLEASNDCVLPMSAKDLLKEIQEKRDSYKVNRQASHNRKIAKSSVNRWPRRITPDMDKVTEYLQSRGMWPKEA
jgi:hypothetical protein|tara:strand:- start:678 stop:998 length:321 start_codon:yes stop_codon:yes gene_type:complete